MKNNIKDYKVYNEITYYIIFIINLIVKSYRITNKKDVRRKADIII